jgi:manganese-dependent inorganic pyrophosphatase
MMDKDNKTVEKTVIIGHRNPDTDSVAAAAALTELKKQQGMKNVFAACAGLPGARTEYIFKRFNVPLPRVITDIHLKVEDIMNPKPDSIICDDSLLKAIEIIEEKRKERLPVIEKDNKFHGMLSLFALLEYPGTIRNADLPGAKSIRLLP